MTPRAPGPRVSTVNVSFALVERVLVRRDGERLGRSLEYRRALPGVDREVGRVVSRAPAVAMKLTVASSSVPSVRLTVYVAGSPSGTDVGPVIVNCLRVVRARLSDDDHDQAGDRKRGRAEPARTPTRHFRPPPSTCRGCTTITVRKKGSDENLPGRRGPLMSSGVAADTASGGNFCFLHSQIQRNERLRRHRSLSYVRVPLLGRGNCGKNVGAIPVT